jgi:hypothetical protein
MSAQSSRILSENEALRAVKLDGKCDEAHTNLTRRLGKSPVATSADYPENGLVKPPRRDTRALSRAGMFGGKALLRLAAQKSRPHAPLAPMRCKPAY